jgi:hypothetical protein
MGCVSETRDEVYDCRYATISNKIDSIYTADDHPLTGVHSSLDIPNTDQGFALRWSLSGDRRPNQHRNFDGPLDLQRHGNYLTPTENRKSEIQTTKLKRPKNDYGEGP